MPTSKRKTNREQWKQPKMIDKLHNYPSGAFYSQTEMDLESQRRIVSKQKVIPVFCVKVC